MSKPRLITKVGLPSKVTPTETPRLVVIELDPPGGTGTAPEESKVE